MRRFRSTSLLVALLLIGAACGQKANVSSVAAGGDGFAPVESGAGVDTDGDGVVDAAPAPGSTDGFAVDGGATPAAGAPGGATGGSGGGTPGAAPEGGGGGGAPPAGDRTGITEDTIKIGVHAPVSGAAPFPQTSFERGAPVYWQWLEKQGGVFGKKVELIFEDDEFNPATAKRVCQKMVEQDKVFMLVGGGGADQITTCANYAQSVGVPYLSAGVNEQGLANIRAYFALSMTYSQQSPLLAQLAKNQLGGGKVGIAVADTASFNDAYDSIQKAMKDQGLNVVYADRIPKSASQAEALSIANELRTKGAEIVYVLTSPTTFLNLASAGGGQGYVPQYIGPGISSGLNTVAQVGCPNIGKAKFLSPFPQLDVVDQMDPNFRKAYREIVGSDPDDISLALWGLNKGLHAMFTAAGKDMTRQSFVQTLESGKPFETGLYPKVQFSGTNHLGAAQAHLLEADCGSRTYKTIARFASSF